MPERAPLPAASCWPVVLIVALSVWAWRREIEAGLRKAGL